MRTTALATALILLTACTVHVRNGGPGTAPPPPPPAGAPAPVAAAPAPAAPVAAPPPDPGTPIAIGAPVIMPAVIGAPSTPGFDPLPPNQPPVVEPPPPATPAPVAVAPNIANGQPPNMKPGAPAAYWIWRDGNGWHLRTTTAKTLQRFNGKIWSDVTEVKPVRLEMKDRLKASTKSVIFAFDTGGHLDGFDFRSNGCATFNLQQGGNKKVFIGSGEVQPANNHFTLCP